MELYYRVIALERLRITDLEHLECKYIHSLFRFWVKKISSGSNIICIMNIIMSQIVTRNY